MKKVILSAAIASAIAAAAVAIPQDKPRDPQEPQAVQSSQAQAPAKTIARVDHLGRQHGEELRHEG